MTYRKLSAALLLLGVLSIVSCASKFQKEIEEVEKMEITLKAVNASYNTIDPKKIESALADYAMISGQIKLYFNPDSITQEISQTLDNYKGIKKGGKSFSADYGSLKNNISLIESQLEKLKTDFKNDAIKPEDSETFLNHERNNLELVQKNLSTLLYNYDFVLETNDSLGPKVKALIIHNDN